MSYVTLCCSVGGLRQSEAREKLEFSRMYNEKVLGFGGMKQELQPSSAMKPSDDVVGGEKQEAQADSGAVFPQMKPLEEEKHPNANILKMRTLAHRLNVTEFRKLQEDAFHMLMNAGEFETVVIQAPTSFGKDMLPFMVAIATNQAQFVFVPFVALTENVVLEGLKFGCKVVKMYDIGKTLSIETAAQSADVIVCSYEHSLKAVRIAQEMQLRGRLGVC